MFSNFILLQCFKLFFLNFNFIVLPSFNMTLLPFTNSDGQVIIEEFVKRSCFCLCGNEMKEFIASKVYKLDAICDISDTDIEKDCKLYHCS